ncbi:MAG: histidine--tRNA ligase [Spirochaetaceae bacterium]|nr:histidine--tRNA ligase [Spirochaetaceae bacterium]
MANIIEPRVLKGFRDLLPAGEIARRALTSRIEGVYRLYGYVPIDTPALEYTSVLLGKGGGETEKQVYRFTDSGGRDVALRFDLTVPLARFVAANFDVLPFPFKRYHIAKVWRGENTQRGRYREFTQCDCDAVGEDCAFADFEILCMMREALAAAGAGEVVIHVNHRGLFNRFLARLGLREQSAAILRAVDKRAKIGRAETEALLAACAGGERAREILAYVECAGDWPAALAELTARSGGVCPESERLAALYAFLRDAGCADGFALDPSITRGLDYYTGIVYESFLTGLVEIGSVCSGGRYDDLAGLYTRKKLSGVGASIGLDRLIAALDVLGKSGGAATYAQAAIALVDEKAAGFCHRLAAELRGAGIGCEVLGADAKKAGAFFMGAQRRGLRWALVPVFDDGGPRAITLRDLDARESREGLSVAEVIAAICPPAKSAE